VTRKSALLVVAGVVGFALFAQALRTLGVERALDGFRRVGWGFAAILLLSGAREVARTLAWIRTVEGPARLPFARAFRARLAGEALNTLLPMGMLVGEPVKASHVASHLPFGTAFSALVVEFAFYSISLAVLLGSGTTAFIIAARLSPGPREVAMVATAIVALAVLLPYVRRAYRACEEMPNPSDRRGRGGDKAQDAIARLVRGVRRPFAIVARFAAKHPEHLPAILAFELSYQVLAVAEVYLTLLLISPQPPTLATALVLETVSRAITMLFKMVPMRVGVDEAGSSLFASQLDLGAASGLTLALVRKLRMLFWSAVGLGFLLLRRQDAQTAPALSWPAVGQRVL
jgi:hypothetical protein